MKLRVFAAFVLLAAAGKAVALQNSASAFKLPEGQQFTNTGRQVVSISPDGAQMVYVANTQLYLNRVGQPHSTPIQGSLAMQGITNPVFSPDGRSIAYWSGADQSFKRIGVEGGTPATLFRGMNPYGMSWSSGGRIVVGQATAGIIAAPATGGDPETIIKAQSNEAMVAPQFLPGDEALMFTLVSLPTPNLDTAKVVVQSIKTGERKTLIDPGRDARYLPSGHLVFMRGDNVMAVRFDPQRQEIMGAPVMMVENVQSAGNGSSQFSFSSSGSLVYLASQMQLSYVSLDGKIRDIGVLPSSTFGIRVSHDGKQLVYNTQGADEAIWIYDLASQKQRQLVKSARGPLWTLDDKRIAYISGTESATEMEKLYWQKADGSDKPELLVDRARAPESWSTQDQLLSFITRKVGATLDYDIWTYSLRDKKAKPLIETPVSAQHSSRFSPDGKWMAYASDESGQFEVYVQPFPLTGAKYKISKKPGSLHPVWSPDGRQLYFDDQERMYSVQVRTQPSFQTSEPVAMPMSGFVAGGVNTRRQWDMTPDGKQFIMVFFKQEIRSLPKWGDDVRSRVK